MHQGLPVTSVRDNNYRDHPKGEAICCVDVTVSGGVQESVVLPLVKRLQNIFYSRWVNDALF